MDELQVSEYARFQVGGQQDSKKGKEGGERGRGGGEVGERESGRRDRGMSGMSRSSERFWRDIVG